jgi:hypothetical protein
LQPTLKKVEKVVYQKEERWLHAVAARRSLLSRLMGPMEVEWQACHSPLLAGGSR